LCISKRRPLDAPLYPNPRRVYIEDSSGRRFELSSAGEHAVEEMGWESTPLSKPLIPGQSYITQLAFDLRVMPEIHGSSWERVTGSQRS
jgi:hypothetical protein